MAFPGESPARIQSLEQAKNLLMKLWGNTDSIVVDVTTNHAGFIDRANLNLGCYLITHKLNRVFDQVHENLNQSLLVSKYLRHIASCDFNPLLLDPDHYLIERLPYNIAEVTGFRFIHDSTNPTKFE